MPYNKFLFIALLGQKFTFPYFSSAGFSIFNSDNARAARISRSETAYGSVRASYLRNFGKTELSADTEATHNNQPPITAPFNPVTAAIPPARICPPIGPTA